MQELLTKFSLNDIILYGIILIGAIKKLIDFIKWCQEKYNEKFNKDYIKKNKEFNVEQQFKNCAIQHQEVVEAQEKLYQKIDNLTHHASKSITDIEEKINILTSSTMHDIKGWIVEKHHKLIRKGWVDDFTMDTLEKRYNDYKIMGGNSYIEGLMNEIRALPHTPPTNGEA